MRSEGELQELTAKYKSQREDLGETVTIEENAPVALMQLELETKIKLLNYILKG